MIKYKKQYKYMNTFLNGFMNKIGINFLNTF